MSSPVHDDLDKRYMYAPPWARDVPQKLRAAAPSPHDDAAASPPRRHQADRDQPELPLGGQAHPLDIEAAMADAVHAAWTPPPLEPVMMPEPPKPRLGGPTWGMFARLASAVGFAAAAALFVTGAVPLPSIEISLNAGAGAKAVSSFVQAFSFRDAREETPAPVLVADASPAVSLPASAIAGSAPSSSAPSFSTSPSSAMPAPAPAAAPPVEVLSAYASVDNAAVPSPSPPGPKIESPQVAAAAPAAKSAELDREELAGLLKRAQALLAEGDISSARLLLRRAAEAGDATAALTLAGTYDRVELAKHKVIGFVHDHAQARLWYTKAVANGSAEAVRRLQQLAQRAD